MFSPCCQYVSVSTLAGLSVSLSILPSVRVPGLSRIPVAEAPRQPPAHLAARTFPSRRCRESLAPHAEVNCPFLYGVAARGGSALLWLPGKCLRKGVKWLGKVRVVGKVSVTVDSGDCLPPLAH